MGKAELVLGTIIGTIVGIALGVFLAGCAPRSINHPAFSHEASMSSEVICDGDAVRVVYSNRGTSDWQQGTWVWIARCGWTDAFFTCTSRRENRWGTPTCDPRRPRGLRRVDGCD